MRWYAMGRAEGRVDMLEVHHAAARQQQARVRERGGRRARVRDDELVQVHREARLAAQHRLRGGEPAVHVDRLGLAPPACNRQPPRVSTVHRCDTRHGSAQVTGRRAARRAWTRCTCSEVHIRRVRHGAAARRELINSWSSQAARAGSTLARRTAPPARSASARSARCTCTPVTDSGAMQRRDRRRWRRDRRCTAEVQRRGRGMGTALAEARSPARRTARRQARRRRPLTSRATAAARRL